MDEDASLERGLQSRLGGVPWVLTHRRFITHVVNCVSCRALPCLALPALPCLDLPCLLERTWMKTPLWNVAYTRLGGVPSMGANPTALNCVSHFVSCLALPCLMPCLALPFLALPCPCLPCLAHTHAHAHAHGTEYFPPCVFLGAL